jgi:hypothetical protein
MFGKILMSGELGRLASFATPAFFDVMPRKALWARTKSLYAATRDPEAFRHAVAARGAQLESAMPELKLVAERSARDSQPASSPAEADKRASNVVELYFFQLFHDGVTLLDLRASAFTFEHEPKPSTWHPSSWLVQWSPDFIGPLREIYRGFYAHDDALFRHGLDALSLIHSEDLFRAQFGGDQKQVRFRTAEFIRTFHQVFLRCKQAGTTLHPDFLPLGIYLAALYDHLEALAVPVDVAAAYESNLELSHA